MSLRPWPVFAVARFFGIDSWRALGWVSAGAAMVVGLFLVQYSKFGLDRYLGWDTSTVVQMARHIQVFGPFDALTTFRYPYAYVYLNWALGTLAGDIGFGERVLPVIMGMILVALYFRLGREMFPGDRLAYPGICAWLAALSSNLMILVGGLHRNLFALIAAFAALIVLAELHAGKRSRNSAVVSVVLLSALAAFTQFETYVVLLLTIVFHSLTEQRHRWPAVGSVVLPVLVASPFLITYFTAYVQYAAVRDPADPALTFADLIYFHGGLQPLLPLAVLGAFLLAKESRRHSAARLVWTWYAILILLAVVLWVIDSGLPPLRPLILMPVPILLALGIRELSRVFYRVARLLEARIRRPEQLLSSRGGSVRMMTSSVIAVVVLLAVGVGLSMQKDVYMQPFITESLYADLKEVGRACEPYGSSWPILVFHGFNGTLYYSIERAYVGALSGPVLAYFGRPQFLLSLTDPLLAEPGLSDESIPSRFVATQLYQGLGGREGSWRDLAAHAIVVSSPGLYDRPVSDYFVVRHRVSPGLYVVPPGAVTLLDRSTWVWFGGYDWRASMPFNNVAYPWSLAPRVLEYTFTSLPQAWSTEYFMELPQTTSNATLSLHLLDTPPFPPEWNILPADVGALKIYVDDVLLARYVYGYQGVRWVNFSIASVSPGYHWVTIRAEDIGRPFALALDSLVFSPEGVDWDLLIAAYDG